jgi:hypothetical protein
MPTADDDALDISDVPDDLDQDVDLDLEDD